jgi:hypothetical protein
MTSKHFVALHFTRIDFRILRARILSRGRRGITERLLRFVRGIAGGIAHRFVRRFLERRRRRIVHGLRPLRLFRTVQFLRHVSSFVPETTTRARRGRSELPNSLLGRLANGC